MWGIHKSKMGRGGGTQKRGRVWDTTFLTALSGRHETMSERPPEAALVRFTLISTDEPCWLWPGNRQAAPTQSTQPLMTEVQISGRSTHMVPIHIRRLSVWQQEAVAQIYVHKPQTILTSSSMNDLVLVCVSVCVDRMLIVWQVALEASLYLNRETEKN